MRWIICAAALAACFVTPAFAKPPKTAPLPLAKPEVCKTLEVTRAEMAEKAKSRGDETAAIDGDVAQKFLDAINHIGQPTDFKADHVGIIRMSDRPVGIVLIADNPCGGYGHFLTMSFQVITAAYMKAIGVVEHAKADTSTL